MTISDFAFKGKALNVPVIDAHTHTLPTYKQGYYQSLTKNSEIIELMDHLGIDCMVTAPHSLFSQTMDYTNRMAAMAAEEYPGRIYCYISICPHEGISAVKDIIKRYSENSNFIGFKLLAGYHGSLLSDGYCYAMDFANEVKCPVISHTWAGNPGMDEIEAAAMSRPCMKLIMAHQGGGYREYTEKISPLVNNYKNLYIDICGSLYNYLSIEEMVDMTGEEKIIYGSDMINLDPRFDLGKIIFSTLEDGIKKKLLAGNYLKLLEESEMGKIQRFCKIDNNA